MTTTNATTTVNDPNLEALTKFTWEPQPKAAAFVKKVVDEFLAKLPEAAAFAERLYRETGNRFGDLIDQIWLPLDSPLIAEMEEAGWKDVNTDVEWTQYRNCTGMFPSVLVSEADDEHTSERHRTIGVDLKVESVADYLAATGLIPTGYLHPPGSDFRYQVVSQNAMAIFGVVERHGARSPDSASPLQPDACRQIASVIEMFRLRNRNEPDAQAFARLNDLLDEGIALVGRDRACDLFFAAEREYWQRRNTAAQFQKARQDRLGIGWANHDHHTYRSSRRHFHRLVALWEKLGFEIRERFYPGPEAGWGAQVMEQPVCGIVTFNDVDISADELMTDFAHEPMAERDHLGTVGLWCALHGESVLQAGMHHLECTFDFAALEQQMAEEGGIRTMKKFTDFPHLKQAFTQGERWKVDPARIDRLLERGLISQEQADTFRTEGAIGSHLENLERNDGFKGFNQTGVTEIIRDTDPRKQPEN